MFAGAFALPPSWPNLDQLATAEKPTPESMLTLAPMAETFVSGIGGRDRTFQRPDLAGPLDRSRAICWPLSGLSGCAGRWISAECGNVRQAVGSRFPFPQLIVWLTYL